MFIILTKSMTAFTNAFLLLNNNYIIFQKLAAFKENNSLHKVKKTKQKSFSSLCWLCSMLSEYILVAPIYKQICTWLMPLINLPILNRQYF